MAALRGHTGLLPLVQNHPEAVIAAVALHPEVQVPIQVEAVTAVPEVQVLILREVQAREVQVAEAVHEVRLVEVAEVEAGDNHIGSQKNIY